MSIYLNNNLHSREFLCNKNYLYANIFYYHLVGFVIFEVIRATYTNNNKVDKSDYENLQPQLRLAQEENIRILSNSIEQEKKVLSGVDILKQIEEIRGVRLEKDNNYQKDDCELYNLSYYDTEGFSCYAGVNDDMILMHSPIVDMIPNESEDVFMKVLHFCHDFNHNYRGVEKLRCYQLNYKYPDDESRYRNGYFAYAGLWPVATAFWAYDPVCFPYHLQYPLCYFVGHAETAPAQYFHL